MSLRISEITVPEKKKLAIANKKYVDEKILIVKLHGILKL